MKSCLGLATAFLFSSISFAGVLIGNGGDSILCKGLPGSAKFAQDGFYVLDYIVAFPEDLHDMIRVETLQSSLDRIEGLLMAKAPEAVESFRSFRSTLTPIFTETPARVWLPSEVPLRNIRDEYAKVLPPNCRFQLSVGHYYGVYQQTVIRQNVDGRIEYHYDVDRLADYLSREDAAQASILFVHEWLWDYYEHDRLGAPKIRRANQFLHSNKAENATPKFLKQMVFHNPGFP